MIKILKSGNSRNFYSFLVPFCQRSVSTLNIEKEKAKKILLENYFTENETNHLLQRIDPYLRCASQIDSSLSFWRKIQRNSSWKQTDNEQEFKNVFLTKEPRLIFVESNFLHERIKKLKSLDFVAGSKDLWKLFITSPTGYFMQDWNEFLRKYYYITFKILPWIEVDSQNKITNPLMSCPEVIELPYDTIKTRFIFAQRTGAKNFGNTEKVVNLKNLLLTSPKEFLSIYAPNCSLEELNALEMLHSKENGEEDDKLFDELVRLAPKENRKDFFTSNLTETYILSDIK